jgi:hypothetical protein
MKLLALATALLLSLSLLAGLESPPSTAEAKCAVPFFERPNSPGNRHAGWIRSLGATVFGVRSYVFNYDPLVWPNGSASTAWVMLTITGNDNVWAQVGWIEYFAGERHTVVQYTTPEYDPDDEDGTLDTWLSAPQAEGTFTEYRVESAGSLWIYWAGSSPLASSLKYFTPNEGQISGEILNLQSQMPGGFNSPEVFQLSYIKTSYWMPFDGFTQVTPGFEDQFGALEFSAYQALVWDWLCTD